MNRNVMRHVLALVLAVVLIQSPLFSTLAWGQAAAGQKETKEEKKLREKQEKEKKKEEERKKKEEKNKKSIEKKYNTLKEFALDLYDSKKPENQWFRESVDEAYLDLQAQHALQAYQINVTRTTELVSPETEDAGLKIRRVLYDNPWVQDFVNGVGQRLVPDDSDKLYAFKVTYHPIPYAYTLATGTVLISTGMISMLDNEAQLAYVVAHELAHVYEDHWKVKTMMPLAEEEYNKRQEKKRAFWTGIFAAAGAAVGGAAKGGEGAITGAAIGGFAGYVIGSVLNKKIGVDWDAAQENKADDFALKAAMDKYYDAKEVPKLYVAMEEVARFDKRVELGFLGRRARLRERREYTDTQLQGPLRVAYEELLKKGVRGSSPEYNLVMAQLRRDNGIEAYRFDMFAMAKRNLEQVVALRSDDPLAAFYYGRVLKLVGRTPDERKQADQFLLAAINLDTRRTIPEAQLQHALMQMSTTDQATRDQALQALKSYVTAYQERKCQDVSCFPPNLEVLYDYMRLLGDKSAWVPPSKSPPSAPMPDSKVQPEEPPKAQPPTPPKKKP